MTDFEQILSTVPDLSIIGLLLYLLFDTRKRFFACQKEQRELLREIANLPHLQENSDIE